MAKVLTARAVEIAKTKGVRRAVLLPVSAPFHSALMKPAEERLQPILDAAHFKDNWDNDRVPSMNTSAEQTHSSHARLARIVAEKKAALWINHDLPTFDSLKHSPDFYE